MLVASCRYDPEYEFHIYIYVHVCMRVCSAPHFVHQLAITESLYIEYRICEQIPKLWRLESIVEVDHQFAFDLKDDLVIQR